MAWRDSRGSRRRLLLYLSAMVLGVAALVAIGSFGDNLSAAVDAEARTLLGADLSFESEQPFSDTAEVLIDSLGGEQSRRISFSSMAYFPGSGGTRLATVRGIEGDYPYYGAVETEPATAAAAYRAEGGALVDNTLMEQFGAEVGDSVRVGRRSYRIAGRLLQTPRESALVSLVSPRIYLPLARLDTTLLAQGSRAEYEVYFKFDENRDVQALLEREQSRLRAMDIRTTTVAEASEDWSDGLTNLYRFLNLVGFVALLLGSLGVASAVHVYVKKRIETVAVLRCLGAKAGATFRIYLVQAAVMGLIGAALGCALGVAFQFLIPRVLADFLPVEVDVFLSWPSLALGLGIGVGVTLLFALLPLLNVRRVSPLLALRSSFVESSGGQPDPLRWLVYALIAAGITVFALAQAPFWEVGLGYAAGLFAVFGALALVAKGLVWGTRRFAPASWSYPWRQGLANLHRPNNQTAVLMLSLGLGTFLILSMVLVQRTLLDQIELSGDDENQPNLVLFDVQPDQRAGLARLVESQGRPVLDQVPIVTMRLESVQGRSIDALRADSSADLTWAHRREYRSTYRDHLIDSEEIVAGAFTGADQSAVAAAGRPVPVSVEQDIAGELGVGVGDTLTFDVQGVPIVTTVGSLREVDWQRVQTNFFVVFPPGVLDDAPQTYVLLSRAATDAQSAQLQRAVVEQYPNVSAIDLSLVLSVFEALFGRISFVIRFMALFSIGTGLIVLAGAVVVSRYQRVEESVLLKTLGASRRQVFSIMLIEYLFLGLFAALTGLVLAVAASWALALFVFDAPFAFAPGALLAALLAVPALTMAVGLFNSRGLYARPPLEVLRAEV